MKIQKFTAATTQQAMLDIHQSFGSEALIFSNEKTINGVEILAGIAHDNDRPDPAIDSPTFVHTALNQDIDESTVMQKKNGSIEQYAESLCNNLVETFNKKMKILDSKLAELSKIALGKVTTNFQEDSDDNFSQRNALFRSLLHYGFTAKFINKFADEMLYAECFSKGITRENLSLALSPYIRILEDELINKKNIIAFVGPTGSGKTTTIVKLATHYVLQSGSQSLGLISTDFNYFKNRNKLFEYGNLLKVDVEYANNSDDLALALHAFSDKDLILIDTAAVGVKDPGELDKLIQLLKPHEERISSCLMLPCNMQAAVLDEIISAFNVLKVNDCILTKQDECSCLATALSVVMYYGLSLAYICNGKKISGDMIVASRNKILSELIIDEPISNNLYKMDFTPAVDVHGMVS